jgi:hypothetical protein
MNCSEEGFVLIDEIYQCKFNDSFQKGRIRQDKTTLTKTIKIR